MTKRAAAWMLSWLGVAGCAAGAPAGKGEGPMAAAEAARAGAGERTAATATEPAAFDTRMARLPAAPWSDRELGAGEVPDELVHAWRSAANRRRCAPMAPELVRGASARRVSLDGGWAVAFDAPGRAGVMPDGSPCARCGIAAYGVAGTAATPEDWAHLGPADLEPSFRDGSLAEFEKGSEMGAVTANIVAAGQDCVYQVWSFLGQDHLQDLVQGLRFVAVRDGEASPRVADLR